MAKKFFLFGTFVVGEGTEVPEEFHSQIPTDPSASIMKGVDGKFNEHSFIIQADTCQTDPDMLKKEITHKLKQIGADNIRLQYAWMGA